MTKIILLRSLSVLAAGLLTGGTGCHHNPAPDIAWAVTGTVWKVAEINGAMVGAEKIPTMQLEIAGSRMIAFGGVNRLAGTYQLDGTALSFGPLASTRMAGEPGQMAVEEQFQRMLGTVTHFQTKGPWLALLAGEKIVARAQATPAVAFPAP